MPLIIYHFFVATVLVFIIRSFDLPMNFGMIVFIFVCYLLGCIAGILRVRK